MIKMHPNSALPMLSHIFLTISFILTLFLQTSISDTTSAPIPTGSDTNSTQPNTTVDTTSAPNSTDCNPAKPADDDGTYCYDCIEKFKYVIRPGNCILNVSAEYKPRKCQAHEKFCKVEWTKVNRIYSVFERNCQSDCETFCKIRGYGLWEETCRYCCTGNGCNTTDTADTLASPNRLLMCVIVIMIWILGR